MELDNTFWAFVCLLIFLGLAVYFGLPRIIAKMLDQRIANIVQELDEAKRLRAEAEALLVEYERKRVSAEAEAEDIVRVAQDDAKRLAEEANVALADLIARRTRAVEQKIAQAETQALADVRARSVDLAVEAARLLLSREVQHKGDALVDQAIRDVGARLN